MDKDAPLGDGLGHTGIEYESERLGFDAATALSNVLDHVKKLGLLRRKLDAKSDHHRLATMWTFGHAAAPAWSKSSFTRWRIRTGSCAIVPALVCRNSCASAASVTNFSIELRRSRKA